MSNANPSIEDLLKQNPKSSSQGDDDTNKKTSKAKSASKSKKQKEEASTQDKFAIRMKQIDLKEKEQEIAGKAAALGVEYVDLAGFPVSQEALILLDKNTCYRLKLVVFLFTNEQIRIGAINPTDKEIKEIKFQLEEANHAKAEIYMISEHSFEKAMAVYEKIPVYKKAPRGKVPITQKDLDKFPQGSLDFTTIDSQLKKLNITETVTLILAGSLSSGSSDIHIEAEETSIKIRYRIDGLLHDVAELPKAQWKKIISRIKLLSGLKINITDKPQDGRITMELDEGKVDVRVSCLPTTYGESVVMRLLKSNVAGLEFDQLGVRGRAFEVLKREAERPNGMIITTGPTGSGKTTTLYAILNKLNDEETKIITLEDPVEYKLKGINQSQIDKSKSYSFAQGLKSILRQDPDVVMVGEIRDLETADIAINAALTGHLVVSTIHTNSAAGAIPRFLAMDVKPFLLAPALNAIIGQRLVRKLCEKCKKPYDPPKELLERAKKLLAEVPEASGEKVDDLGKLQFYTAEGCEACNNLGYKGRTGIYEIMGMDKDIEKVILSGKVSEYDMQDIAMAKGMVTMVQDGLLKAKDGITSIEEVFRVTE